MRRSTTRGARASSGPPSKSTRASRRSRGRFASSSRSARPLGSSRRRRPPARSADAARSGGGFFFEGACHTLDFFDFLFGPVETLSAFAANRGGAYQSEDTVTASLRFASGVHASGAWCYAADVDEEYNEIVGAKGRIRFSTGAPVPIRVYRGNAVEEIPIGDPPHVHQPMIQSIVDELNGLGRAASTGESAARTAWVMDRILEEFRPQRSVA